MTNLYSWPPRKKKKFDLYPNLRTKTRRTTEGPPSRRARMISKALRRADRRWDTYAARVRSERLEWEDSRRTIEWRLILQNLLILRWIRRHRDIPERGERLGRESGQARELQEI